MNPDPQLFQSMPASPEMWRLFLKHMSACVAVLDRDMRYLAVSERWYEDLELTGRDIIGRSHYEIFPDLNETCRDRHRRCLAGETISLGSDDYVLPSGARLTVKWDYVPWRDAQGDIGGMVIFSEVLTRQRMLEELVESEADRLHRAEIVSKSGAWEWDVATNVVTWSEGLSILLGLDDERAAGERPSWARLVHPDDRDAVMAQVGRALQGEIPYDIEMRMLRDDGIILDVRVIAEITRDAQGKPLSVIGAIQDVTELRRKERELSTVLRRYRLASEVSGTAAWEIYPTERRILGDENLARLIGRSGHATTEDLDEWLLAFPPDTRRKLNRMFDEINSGSRSVYDVTLRTRLPDGRTIWLSSYGKVLGGKMGEPLRIIGTTRDVTEIKLAETALQNSERNLLVAQQIAQVGSWEWDIGSETLNCSPEMLRLYGFPSTRQALRLDDLMGRIHPDDLERITREVGKLQTGEAELVENEMRLVRPDQGTVWIRAVARGFTNESGRLVRMKGAVQDITARKVADREIALRDSALRNSAGAVAMAGMDGYFVYGNQAFMDLLGLDGIDSLRKVNALETVPDPDAAAAAFSSLLGEAGRWNGELPIVRVDGGHRNVLVTATVHRAEG